MKPPIIIDCQGDIAVFRTLTAAEEEYEPPEVENGRLKGFDSEGRLLAFSVILVRSFLTVFRRERVRIEDAEQVPAHGAELASTLARFLSYSSGRPQDEAALQKLPLNVLLERAVQYAER